MCKAHFDHSRYWNQSLKINFLVANITKIIFIINVKVVRNIHIAIKKNAACRTASQYIKMSLIDAQYMEAVVGDALTEALAEVSFHQPHDPVAFVAKYLRLVIQKKHEEARVCTFIFYKIFFLDAKGKVRFS